jgi:hypothetical protein
MKIGIDCLDCPRTDPTDGDAEAAVPSFVEAALDDAEVVVELLMPLSLRVTGSKSIPDCSHHSPTAVKSAVIFPASSLTVISIGSDVGFVLSVFEIRNPSFRTPSVQVEVDRFNDNDAFALEERIQTEYNGPSHLVRGLPDLIEWFQRIRSTRYGLDGAVNACGPRSLIYSVRIAALKSSGRGGIISVEEEVFEF